MAAYVHILRLLAQPELTENLMARKSDTKEIKNKHSSRPVGGVETGTGAERTLVAMAGPRLTECRTNGAGRAVVSTLWPHIRAQINRTIGGERSRPHNSGLQRGEIKPQTSD